MNKRLSVKANIDIDSKIELVWDALVNPEKIKIYLFGTETISDWKPESEIIFQGEYQGQKYKDKGIIKELKANEIFSYTYWSGFSGMEDIAENYSLITFKMKIVNNKIILDVVQTGFADEKAYQHSSGAWNNILKQIKEICEV